VRRANAAQQKRQEMIMKAFIAAAFAALSLLSVAAATANAASDLPG
jgi:hypothetical protein